MTRWVLPLVLAIALVATGVWGYNQYNLNRQYGIHMDNIYQKSFYDLVASVGSTEIKLSKLMVSSDRGQHIRLLTDLSRQADYAQTNLSQLPISHIAVKKAQKYLNQLSDYAKYLNNKVSDGKTISTEEMDNLRELYRNAVRLNADLVRLDREVQSGKAGWREIVKKGRSTFYETSDDLVTKQFVEMDQKGIEYPTLIYDGPFSEALKDRSDIKGPIISREKAEEIAREFIGRNLVREIRFSSEGSGEFATWGFDVTLRDYDHPYYIQVSRKGGKVVNMIGQYKDGTPKLSVEQAKEKATAFLSEKGYTNMVPTYQQKYGSVSVINLAYSENGIIFYPDLIKVKVSLEDGRILGFEARNYLMAHKERDLEEPKLSLEEARKLVSSKLELLSARLAVIPTDGGNERFCYEFKGKYMGNLYIVYIDAMTGQEADILQVIDTENGSLVM